MATKNSTIPHKPIEETAAKPNAAVKWWQTRNAKIAGIALSIIGIGAFIFWLVAVFPYVSTDDARVDATIVKLANSGVSGQIEKVNVAEGDIVSRDMVLVELDHRTAEAQCVRAEARAHLTSADLVRMESLASQHGISQQQLDRARADAMMARAELQLAQIALEHTFLKSPTTGIVIKKYAEVGNILETNQTALTLVDIEQAWISANIEETSILNVKPGQSVIVHVDEGGTLTGKVAEVRKAAASTFSLIPSDNASGNFIKVVQRIPVKIVLDPHPGKILRVGESVEISIKVR